MHRPVARLLAHGGHHDFLRGHLIIFLLVCEFSHFISSSRLLPSLTYKLWKSWEQNYLLFRRVIPAYCILNVREPMKWNRPTNHKTVQNTHCHVEQWTALSLIWHWNCEWKARQSALSTVTVVPTCTSCTVHIPCNACFSMYPGRPHTDVMHMRISAYTGISASRPYRCTL